MFCQPAAPVLLIAALCAVAATSQEGAATPFSAVRESPALMIVGDQAALIESALRQLQDSPEAPVLVVIPAGGFVMGSPLSEPGHSHFEEPEHRVTITRAFALGATDVTFAQWDACVADGGCNGYRPDDHGWGRGVQPVIEVSYDDVQAYLGWLSRRTGKRYRLPSETEWEYAARAGATTAYWWGNGASHDYANYGVDICCAGLAQGADAWEATSPVGSFPPNPFGLYDMNGNVMQFVADCWHASYEAAPADGLVWGQETCSMRTARGGSWSSPPVYIRSADRIFIPQSLRSNLIGFRVARDL